MAGRPNCEPSPSGLAPLSKNMSRESLSCTVTEYPYVQGQVPLYTHISKARCGVPNSVAVQEGKLPNPHPLQCAVGHDLRPE
jgi:hypothetical protein